MTKILGLDVSSANTGYCIIENGQLIKDTIGSIIPNKKWSMGERISYFAHKLSMLIEEHKPDMVVVEDIFRGPSIKTFKTLSMFRGVCFYVVFYYMGFEPISIMPTKARKLVGCSGMTKECAFEFVVKEYSLSGYKFETHNDMTDAIILALAGDELFKNGLTESDLKPRKKRKKRKK